MSNNKPIAKPSVITDATKVLSSQCIFSLSSQCVTLGSRYKNIYKLCNGQWILGAYVKNNVRDEISWIPVSRNGMTPGRDADLSLKQWLCKK